VNCLLCDQPLPRTGRDVIVDEAADAILGRVHNACHVRLFRRELAHQHAVRSVTEGQVPRPRPLLPEAPRWCPLEPVAAQWDFLRAREREVLFAGGAGGGKTTALLMAALEYVDLPGYSALLLKRWYPDLVQRSGLIDVATRWLRGRVTWDLGGHRATFPSGATLLFSNLDTRPDAGRFVGMEFQFIGLDDVEQLEQGQYESLLRRLRPRSQGNLPLTLRLRATTGQLPLDCPQWLLDRYCNRPPDRRVVLTAHITNPFLAAAVQRAQQEQRIAYPSEEIDAELRRIMHLPPDGATS
jgi:hypothetical protein